MPNLRDMDDVIDFIKKTRLAFFPTVPRLYLALIDHIELKAGNVGFKSMRFCLSGAIPLMADTRQRFEKMTGGRMHLCANINETVIGQ